jgi:signal peptidase
MVVIRGSSMSPAIPLGSVVDEVHVTPEDLKVGDVVTVKSPGGTVYTHRINRIVQMPDGLYIETQGDAVGHPDSPLLPVSEVTGRAGLTLPFLGYLMYMRTIPSGILSIFCLATTMLLCVWLLEDLEADEEEDMRPEGRASLVLPARELIG